MRDKLSAVVIAYNRAPLIGTCVRALGFADELIVVDKSSTDDTPAIAAQHADLVITVPWSPTVEETRAFAVAQCTHDWILCLDDDECLNIEAIRFIQAELAAPRSDVYGLLQRHYILGTHDEAAYYWPEYQIRLFRRGAVTFSSTVHGGTVVHSGNVMQVAPDTGAAIHHLSHQDVAQWIEKTNRYTSRTDREGVMDYGQSLASFAHGSIDHWLSRTRNVSPGGYPEAVAVLRSTYDLIDRLKIWEKERGLDGAAEFRRICASLDAEYATLDVVRERGGEAVTAAPAAPRTLDEHDVVRKRLAEFRAHHEALTIERDAHTAEATRLAGELSALVMAQDETQRVLNAERLRAEQITAERNDAQVESIAQRQRAEQTEARISALECNHDLLQHDHNLLQHDHNLLQGSLRLFLRGYLPLLRRHLLGQRP